MNPMMWEHGEFMDSTEFRQRWGVFISRNGYKQWVRNRHLLTLRKYLHQDSYAITREECFDLPKSRPQIIPVTLEESLPIYREMAEEMIAQLESGEITEAPIKLVQALRLQQITSGIAKTTPTEDHPEARLVRIGHEKLTVMDGLLTDLFEADEKVVVAAQFRADIAAIIEIAKKKRVTTFELHGGIKGRRQRDANIKAFRAHEGPAMFIMQPQAGALGIDLSTASIFIWYSLTRSYVDYSQCKDRVALSKRGVVYMYLLARGTVDELLYETMQEDGDVARAMTVSPQRLLQLSRMRELLEN
jgi:SNF2 family DNA or RNA helicase